MRQIQAERDTTTSPLRPDGVQEAMSTSTLRLLRGLLDVAEQGSAAVARRADLSHAEMAALEMLTRQQRGPTELARHLGVTSAAASGLVDRLVARGHVERRPHPDDKRRTQVVLTPSGRAEIFGGLMPMFGGLQELDASLSDEEREVVDRFLERATAAIRRLV